MSNELPIASPYRSTPEVPVTEAERDQLSRRLNAAYTDGHAPRGRLPGAARPAVRRPQAGELVPVVQGLPPLVDLQRPGARGQHRGPAGSARRVAQVPSGIALVAVGRYRRWPILLIAILLVAPALISTCE